MARRSRTDRALAGTAVFLCVLAFVIATGGAPSSADTTGTPDTNNRATLAPAAAPGPSPVATSGAASPGPLTGVTAGQTVHVHVDGAAGKFYGVQVARLCRSGLNVTTSSQLKPTQFGNCIAAPFPGPANDAVLVDLFSDPGKQFVDFDFRVGSGTETSHPGPGAPITCDASNPCSLWLQLSVATTVHPTGNLFKRFDIQYATTTTTTTTAPTTTTTTAPTTTTTTPTTTTTAPTTTTTAPTTTTTAPTTTTTTAPTTTTTAPTTTTTTAPTTTTTTAPTTTTTTAPTTTTTTPTTTTTTTTTTAPTTTTTAPTTTAPTTTTTAPTTTTTAPVTVSSSTVPPSGTITLTSTGWLPGSPASIELRSTPVRLADVAADATGTITAAVTIPSGTAPGPHTLAVIGTAADGTPRTATTGITVSAPAAAPSNAAATGAAPGAALARTGDESLRMLLSGLSLVAGGLLLVIAANRRRGAAGS